MTPLAQAAHDLELARTQLAVSMKSAEQAAVTAFMDGTPELQISRRLGVNRTKVRRWLGKW